MIIKSERIFPAKLEEMNNALEVVEELLEKYECPYKIQTTILVCLEELFVNIVSYAFPNSEGCATLITEFDDEKRYVSISLADNGVPFNPLEADEPDTTLPASERKIGGLGILMVRRMMDQVSYEYKNGFNCLTISKYI